MIDKNEEIFLEHTKNLVKVLNKASRSYMKDFLNENQETKIIVIGAAIHALASLMATAIFNTVDEEVREEFIKKLFVEIIKKSRGRN